MVGTSAGALATTDANVLITNVISSSRGFTEILSLIGYLGGSAFSIAGVMSIKKHVDNPGSEPIQKGIIRLAVGGALLSLPFIIAVMQGSIGENNANTAVSTHIVVYQ